jgi:superfamily II DNA/RNA helicase
MGIQKFLCEDEFTNFSYLCEISHYVTFLSRNSVSMPRMMWQDDGDQEVMFKGHSFSMAAFRSMFNAQLANATSLLFDEVLLGLDLPDIFPDRIHDDLSDTTPGYSFLNDSRNTFFKQQQFLIHAMTDYAISGNQFAYQAHANPSGILWNVAGLRTWMKIAERCLTQLFPLCHYGAGQPARGTELCILSWINTHLHPRNCYWFDNLLNFVTLYNKTQTNMGTQRLISRALEPRVGKLMITWAVFVVPTLVIVADAIKPQSTTTTARRLHTLVFTSMNREWDSDDLSSILSSVSGKPVAEGGLGNPLGLADTRHFMIGIVKKHFRGMVDRYGLADEVFNEQSGHSDDVAMKYAIDAASIQNFPEERLHNFSRLSRMQHTLISDPLNVQPPGLKALPADSLSSFRPGPGQATAISGVSNATLEDIARLVMKLAPALALDIAVRLGPLMQTNIADGYAAITPITPIHKPTPSIQQPLTEHGIELIRVEEVVLSPARYQELQALYGRNASFHSKAQAVAVELSAKRKKDLLVVLPTGGGKSLLFMAAALNQEEVKGRMITVVVVPLNALLADLIQRLTEKKISHSVWLPDWSEPASSMRCLLVTVDRCADQKFLDYLSLKAKRKELARIVVDEIHFVLTSQHYRPAFKFLKQLREISVPIVGLSATLPPSHILELCKRLHLTPSSTQLIRASTVRENVVYTRLPLLTPWKTDGSKFDFTTQGGAVLSVVPFIKMKADALKPHERILGFTQSRDDAEDLAALLGCGYYHGKLDESARRNALQLWEGNSGSPVLIATNAFGAGVDCNVRLVFHYGSPRNHIDHSQESGRVGRDGKEAEAIVFWNMDKFAPKLKAEESDIGVKEQQAWLRTDQCLRLIPGEFFDGCGRSCIQLVIVALCSWCSFNFCQLEKVCPLLSIASPAGGSIVTIFSPNLVLGKLC